MHEHIKIKLYKRGDIVRTYNGEQYTVEHTHIRNYKIFLKLKEINELVDAENIVSEYSILNLPKKLTSKNL